MVPPAQSVESVVRVVWCDVEARGECVRAWDEVCVCVGAAPARGRWQPRVEHVWNKWVCVWWRTCMSLSGCDCRACHLGDRTTKQPAMAKPFSYWLGRVPLINYFYFAFFAGNQPPSRSDVGTLLQAIALVSALMFTVVANTPMSISREELMEAHWWYTDG